MGPWGCLYVGGNEEHQRSVEQWREKGYTAWIRGDAGTSMYQDRPRFSMNPHISPVLPTCHVRNPLAFAFNSEGHRTVRLRRRALLVSRWTHREEGTGSGRRMVRWTMVACGARDANDGASFTYPVRKNEPWNHGSAMRRASNSPHMARDAVSPGRAMVFSWAFWPAR